MKANILGGLLVFSLPFVGCVAYPKMPEPQIALHTENLKKIEGTFLLHPQCDPYYLPVNHLVFDYASTHGPIEDNESLIGKLELIDHRTLQISVYRNGINVSKHEIRGKLKKGFFALQGQHYTDNGDGILFQMQEYQKTLLELGKDNQLIVHTKYSEYGQFFLFIILGPFREELLNHSLERSSIDLE